MVAAGTRAFVCVDPSGEARAAAEAVIGRLDRMLFRPVSQDQLHITLFFFESLDDKQVDGLWSVIGAITSAPFEVRLTRMGVFTQRRPEVLLVEAESPELVALRESMRQPIEKLSAPMDSRPFHPHLTLARVRRTDRESAAAVLRFADANKGTAFGSFTCDEVKLVRSELSAEGPVHEVIASKRLL